MSEVAPAATERPAPIPGARYLPLRVLKEGGGVTTMLAIDTETGADVVVKRVDAAAVSPGTRMRLEHESTVLQRLDSPRLASIIDVIAAEGVLCLVLPLAPGTTLADRLAEAPLAVDDALAVAVELFRALAEAHATGVVHRDVKPGNVIVDGAAPDVHLTLVDFGLARVGWLEQQPMRDLPVGTARYVSPEQAGLLHHDVDERADLYSAGAVVFECIAGRPPFDGATVSEVLRAHATARVPHLRTLGNEVPAALDEIVQRLLRKDPRDRYQTAAAVVADLEQLIAARASGVEDPSIVIGVHDERRTLTEPAFVGRRAELAALDAELDRARQGRGGLVLLEAESGGGKSRVLDELAQRSGAAGAWVLRGQGLDHAATLPFQMLTGVADDVVATGGGTAAGFAARIGDHADGVRSALPALAAVLPGTGADLGPAQFGPARVGAALAVLLDALGDEHRPALVLLDDCQWADEPTVRLLERWAAEPAPATGRSTMVVAAFRSEEVGADHPLRRAGARLSLRLSPFTTDDVRGLVESMAGPLPDQAVAVVEELAAGSPFMASAVLRGLVEIGALVREGDAWEVDGAAIEDVQSSRRAAAFLTRRLRLLPDHARALLTVGAVLGKEFDLDLAATLATQDASQAVAAVDEARRRHILWVTGHGGRYAFVHDKLRETLLADVTPDELAALHLRAAEHLEGEEPAPFFELGYHFDAAGEPERALPYALAAGDEAKSRHALELAERQYRVAERGAGDDRRASLRAAMGLGEILLLQGRYAEAGEQLETARLLADDDATRAEIAWRMGELAFKRGDVREAGTRLEDAHRLMGRRPPQHAVTYLVRLVWEVVVQLGHTLLPKRLGKKDPVAGAADLAAARVYSRMAYAYWFSRGRVPTAWAHLRGMNIAERYPPGPELAQAWSEHAPVMTVIPLFARALTYADRSLVIREQLGDVWGQGQSLHFRGVALYASSRYEECMESCRRAVRLLQRTGDQWEVHTATWHIAFCQYRLGMLDAAVATAQRVHRSGIELGDHQAAGIGLGAWSKAAGGRLPAELVAAELARTRDDVHTSAEVLQAEALRLLDAGRLADALAVLVEADDLVRRSGLRQEYVSPVVAWLATAQRMEVEALGPWAPRVRRGSLRRARRTVRRARRTARWYRNNQPHVLREAGLLAALGGRDRKARALLARSLAVADAHGARHERALTLLARGRAGEAAGWPGAADDTATGRALMAELRAAPIEEDVAPTLSLADRFERLLDEGRRVAGALSAAAVYETVVAAAEGLLRPQACRVVDLTGDWQSALSAAPASSEPFVSRSLIERAVRLGRPVSSGQDAGGDPGDSMLFSTSRSALAAPIYRRGMAAACLYVTHDEVGGLYGVDDERVAQLITSIAGAALENAEGFAAVEALTHTLEQRVATRTEELAVANRELDRSLAELRVALEREKEVAERLRSLDQLKNEFVAIVAHDLRSPMASISGAAKTLLSQWERMGEDDRRTLIEMIDRNTLGLSGLVEDVLQVARIESGQFSYELESFDLLDVVASTAREMEVGAEVRIVVDAPPGLPPAYADPQRTWQVVTNLLSNAVKYSPDGSVVDVTITVDGAMLRVAIRDEGSGIAAEDMPRLFQKFSRIRTSDVRGKIKGTGLGLYICQQVVEAQGGRIWVESEPGVGSTFIFTIPLGEGRPVS